MIREGRVVTSLDEPRHSADETDDAGAPPADEAAPPTDEAALPGEPAIDPRVAMRESVIETIHSLLVIKGRLPLLRELESELDRFAKRRATVANKLVYQVVHDSFDMLVIDLESLRTRMTSQGGVFGIVEKHCRMLHRFTEADIGDKDAADEPWLKAKLMEHANKVFDRAFPCLTGRVKGKHVDALRLRFKRELKPLEEDRNHVRAHRYERHASLQHFQPLWKVEEHIKVFESYLSDLLFLIDRTQYSMNAPGLASPESTAADLTDLIVHGSINSATIAYGMAPATADQGPGEPPWYWWHRQRFLRADVYVSSEGTGDGD
jgi:hypothetical protein